jgi:hypothetical protein
MVVNSGKVTGCDSSGRTDDSDNCSSGISRSESVYRGSRENKGQWRDREGGRGQSTEA